MIGFLFFASVLCATVDENGIIRAGHSVQEWKGRIIYQVLTDRFARTDGANSSCNLGKYCGGTYRGLINHLDYIKNLGMDAIWISPIVENTDGSYHGYHATNFYKLNTNFGSESDFKEFVQQCHNKGIWVMVDTVFNHVGPVGTDFGRISPFNRAEHYHDWCEIRDYGNQDEVERCRIAGLPDLKQENSWVKEQLISWANWLVSTYDIDGLRIDTVKHVPKWFWSELVNRMGNIYMIGEVFDGNPAYLKGYTNIMHGQLSYPMYYTLLDVYAHKQSCYKIRDRFNDYANNGIDNTQLGGFIDNHDNKRWLSINRDWNPMKNSLAFTLLSSAIPFVYYGTEQGYTGGDDPNNREPLWYSGFNQNHELYKFIATTAAARKQISTSAAHVERYVDDIFYAFSRDKVLVCTTNRGSNSGSFTRQVTYLPFSSGQRVRNIYTNEYKTVGNNGLSITMSNGLPQVWVCA